MASQSDQHKYEADVKLKEANEAVKQATKLGTQVTNMEESQTKYNIDEAKEQMKKEIEKKASELKHEIKLKSQEQRSQYKTEADEFQEKTENLSESINAGIAGPSPSDIEDEIAVEKKSTFQRQKDKFYEEATRMADEEAILKVKSREEAEKQAEISSQKIQQGKEEMAEGKSHIFEGMKAGASKIAHQAGAAVHEAKEKVGGIFKGKND